MSKVALISVYNKDGIVNFAQELIEMGWKILASGGTAKVLKEAGILVTDVADFVGGGPILGHRVVTLSREVHAGLLAQYDDADLEELENLELSPIDLVCVDLYPLQEEINKPESTTMSVIEKTDIGGPTMLRSAAKGRRIVICNFEQREQVLDWLKEGEPDKDAFITNLAAEAEFLVSQYCLASAKYHSQNTFNGILGKKVLTCKYGENGVQAPAFLYSEETADPLGLDKFVLKSGSLPSYNNMCDIERLLQTITHIAAGFDVNYGKIPFIAIAVKHGNACGAAIGINQTEVLQKMIQGDTRAIFGGLVMTNFSIDEALAEVLLTYQMDTGRRLLDGIIAPSFTDEAVEMLRRKGDKCRFLSNENLLHLSRNSLDSTPRFRYVRGGFLFQPNYTFVIDFNDHHIEKVGLEINDQQKADLILAWAIGCTSNSNTITLVLNGMLLGNAVGQQDRVGSANLAITRALSAGHQTQNAVAYSDSFFPFTDGIETLIIAGIKAILASSGSVKDGDVKKCCVNNDVALFMIPDSEGRGFYGH